MVSMYTRTVRTVPYGTDWNLVGAVPTLLPLNRIASKDFQGLCQIIYFPCKDIDILFVLRTKIEFFEFHCLKHLLFISKCLNNE